MLVNARIRIPSKLSHMSFRAVLTVYIALFQFRQSVSCCSLSLSLCTTVTLRDNGTRAVISDTFLLYTITIDLATVLVSFANWFRGFNPFQWDAMTNRLWSAYLFFWKSALNELLSWHFGGRRGEGYYCNWLGLCVFLHYTLMCLGNLPVFLLSMHPQVIINCSLSFQLSIL